MSASFLISALELRLVAAYFVGSGLGVFYVFIEPTDHFEQGVFDGLFGGVAV